MIPALSHLPGRGIPETSIYDLLKRFRAERDKSKLLNDLDSFKSAIK
jgi:hypothetical protein